MAETIRTWDVTPTGEGRPDYTGEQFRSAGFARYNLRYNESFRFFLIVLSNVAPAYPYVQPTLAPGVTIHLIEPATGFPMPATIPQGYAWRFLSDDWSFDRLARIRAFFDGVFIGEGYTETLGYNYFHRIQPHETSYLDPLGASAHTWDTQLTNVDIVNLSGYLGNIIVQYAMGTKPLPKTKTVLCQKCGSTKKVSNDTTAVKCLKCGETTRYHAVVDWRTQRR